MPTGRKKGKAKTTIYPGYELLDKLTIIAALEDESRNNIIEKFLQESVKNYQNQELVEEILEAKEEGNLERLKKILELPGNFKLEK